MNSAAHAKLASELLQNVAKLEAELASRHKDTYKVLEDSSFGRIQQWNNDIAHTINVAQAHALTAVALHMTGGEK